MAFIYNIPQSTDQISQSQSQILGNFTALGVIAGNGNNASASLNSTSGFNWLFLPPQGSQPPAGSSFTAGYNAIYSSPSSITSINEIYLNKYNQASAVQIPMTASTLSTNATPASNAGMWTYLPSGLLMVSGSQSGALSGLITVTPSFGTTFTQILSVVVCPFNGSSTGDLDFAVRLVNINSATSFRVYVSNRTTTGAASISTTGFQYIAIGY